MPFIWREDFNTGISLFDSQHKKIFSIINALERRKSTNTNIHDIDDLLLELKNYGQEHLISEEKCFIKYGYPDKIAHTKLHNEYRKKIFELINKRKKDIDEILEYTRKWWLYHVTNIDKNYSKFFEKENIK